MKYNHDTKTYYEDDGSPCKRYTLATTDGARPQGLTGPAWPAPVYCPPLIDEHTWMFQPDGHPEAYYVDGRDLVAV